MQGYSGKTQVKVWAWALVEAMPWCCCQSANSPCWRSLNMFERRISQQSVSCGLVSKMAVLAHSRLAVYDYFSQCHCKQHHFHGRQLLYSAVASQRRDADAGSGLSCAVPTDWHWQPIQHTFSPWRSWRGPCFVTTPRLGATAECPIQTGSSWKM